MRWRCLAHPKSKVQKLPAHKTGGLYETNCSARKGFVEASPSRVFRDGEGRFRFGPSHYPSEAGLDTRFLRSYSLSMEVYLTPDQKAFVSQAIESGRLQHEEDAVKEALSLWEERERRRLEILLAVDEAEASLARGEGRVITEESMRELAEDVKQRGRARLAAEQQTPR